ncbi:50S ribosomal protein L10 [Haploplasma modicum]|jgi:large subunit ribosomal protein L10|uniref:50S ribosomal protein L10 n=1 Tax=Haploplasma modicum TaxID=2150 RepID=UPI00047BAEFB|nr:50S ribosomal protein L10 [Haploplasma modicum]MCR1809150.1 50S ribosomal protein L10 [Haploplasma modicum]
MERASVVKKVAAVEVLQEKIKLAKTAILFDYKGLTVDQFTKLRRNLRNEGCDVTVHKNNIARRAAIAAGYEGLAEAFVGPKALILGFDDVVAPAKIIADFAKDNKVVVIDGGIIEGKVVTNKEVMDLANLPSRETLLTQLAAGLLMPVREIAIGLNMISEQKDN